MDLYISSTVRAQELCESRGGRPGLPSLINCGRKATRNQIQDGHLDFYTLCKKGELMKEVGGGWGRRVGRGDSHLARERESSGVARDARVTSYCCRKRQGDEGSRGRARCARGLSS